jgi:uncharacterized protein (DUF433 family)
MRGGEFTTSEAAAVTEQPVHRIQKLIDSGTIPKRLASGSRRILTDADLIFVWVLDRAFADAEFDNKFKAMLHAKIAEIAGESCAVRRDELRLTPFLVVRGLRGLVSELRSRVEKLHEASASVESDPAIKGGEPVIRGTRVPVYLVAAMLDQGATPQEILEDYPTLDDEKIELARVFVKANPRLGRPPKHAWR